MWLLTPFDSYTYADVADRVDRTAVGLAERGVRRGDRVMSLCGNAPETLFVWFAANRLGAIAAPLNPALKPPELAALERLIEPRVIVGRDGVDADALASNGTGSERAPVSPDDVAILIATSGTTGAPKAVAQTHRTYTLTAESFLAWIGIGERDRLLAALPLFHINAQAYSVMGALGAGASVALLPKFHARSFWQDARSLGATQTNVVGAMLHILLATAASSADRAHAIRTVYAALALPEEKHRAFEERFGVRALVGYGMSETTFGTIWPRDEPPRFGTMGKLRQHASLGTINRARVVRDDGTDAAPDEPGELWLSNPAIMSGYWNDAAETARTLSEGWLHTGDVVRQDADGYFTFVSRKKDMIRRRGENISSVEIEQALLLHPAVHEAAAIGVPSELGEDDIVAYVALRENHISDSEALRDFVRQHIADFKVPKIIHIRAELPKTPTQRIAKHLL